MSRVAVVTAVAGRHEHLRAQRRGLARSTEPLTHVVVAMGDPSIWEVCLEPPCVPTEYLRVPAAQELPLAAARNAGVACARRMGADVVVFLDVDCIPSETLATDYLEVLGALGRLDGDGGGPAVVTGRTQYLPPAPEGGYDLDALTKLGRDHPARPVPEDGAVVEGDVRLLWTLNCALTVDDFDAVGGFDEGYHGYGGEDTDFGQRLGHAQGKLWFTASARAWHQHHAVSDPPVEHLDAILRNANRFQSLWGWFPMEGWLAGFQNAGLAHQRDGKWQKVSR